MLAAKRGEEGCARTGERKVFFRSVKFIARAGISLGCRCVLPLSRGVAARPFLL
ncbi:unnamed protein product [Chondrus crispus]|uniref:Uncharacterized protein n=1 Tax=Chondrus crispus TaxID=2769 RepID=R7QT43_CHOCR|nr:unnamed protein product [Chondrus crispus]CDF41304.1 unnamed protein product [Chondrus crispus]|eukprot:XP_005711598.1 unnamed protein product [Chondrus crispus]